MTATRCHRIDAAGVQLQVDEAGKGTPVVLLHGFTGSARAMAFLAQGLCDSHRTLAPDLVGHGRSQVPQELDAYSMSACVEQLASSLDQLGVRDTHLIGYSMGGRLALAFGVAHPARVMSALLVGASAGIRDPEQRAQRMRADEALAQRIERDGVEAFVESWISQSALVSERRLGAQGVSAARELRLANSAHGLASSLRGMGTGAQPSLHAELARIAAPICLAVGDEDSKFQAIAAEICLELPNARVEIVPRAGHAAHSDNPVAFLELARRFLAKAEGREASAPAPTHAAPEAKRG